MGGDKELADEMLVRFVQELVDGTPEEASKMRAMLASERENFMSLVTPEVIKEPNVLTGFLKKTQRAYEESKRGRW